jgi:hypothetical protein
MAGKKARLAWPLEQEAKNFSIAIGSEKCNEVDAAAKDGTMFSRTQMFCSAISCRV